MDANLRLILAWTGQVLVYATPVVAALLCVAFFGQLTQRVARSDRKAIRVAEFQGLILLVGAMGCLGIGLALLSLSVAALVPLGVASIALALLIGAYGTRLMRTRS